MDPESPNEEELEGGVLNFLGASFGFERRLEVRGQVFGLFTRRETENESRFRPQLIRRWAVVPWTEIAYDRRRDVWVLRDAAGRPKAILETPSSDLSGGPAARPSGDFQEGRVNFRTRSYPDRLEVYLPVSHLREDQERELLRSLGLDTRSAGPPSRTP
jgi:hypothetical protein